MEKYTQKLQAQDMQQTEALTSTSMEVDENVNINENLSTLSNLPFILKGEYFKVTANSTDQKIIAQCQNCPKTISGSRTSTGNFVSHYNRLHPQLSEKIKLKRLEDKKSLKHNQNQRNIVPMMQNKKSITVTQAHDLILTYLIEEMRPLNTVEKPSFRNLIYGLLSTNEPEKFLPGRHALHTEINNSYKTKKLKLKELLEKQTYICLTTDIWSCRNKSYLGMTVHFILDTFERQSYMLACRRILYNHTYKNIAVLMHNIMTDFNLDVSKITHVITDNATNFGKVFRCFGVTKFENFENQFIIESNENTFDNIDESDSDIEVTECRNIFTNTDTTVHENEHFTDELGNEIILPPQLTCCSHTLNLIATTDCKKILEDPKNASLKKIYRSTFAKLSAFWNILSRSTVASDICFKECNCKFPIPIITRWNSQYDAIKKILAYKIKLNILFEKLKIQKLRPNEIEFLEEFITIMSPLATSLDILQEEKMTFLGLIAPTIIVLKEKLIKFTHLSYCKPLVSGIVLALDKRFQYIYDFNSFKNKQFILSAICLPRFKLNWVPEHYVEMCKDLFLKEIENMHSQNTVFDNKSTSSSSGDEDFFRDIDKKKGVSNLVQPEISSNIEALSYLESKLKELNSLHSYPNVKKMFFKYNTSLPSSAPVERLFSSGQQIYVPRRNRLSDITFEKLLFLRNKSL